MSTGRSSRVDSLAEIEQRLRAENQQYLAIMRQEITQEIREELIGSQHIPFENPSDQQQLQRQQQQSQQQQIPSQNQPDQLQRQRQRVNPRPPVQQNQAVGRNPQSSFYQPDQFHEDEYRPNMSYTDEPVDQTFFDNLQHDPILQTLIGDEDLEIPGFTNATHDGASGSGINNIQDVGTAFVNQSGGGGITPFNLTSFQGGPNEFNVSGGRTSARSTSGGRTSSRGASGGRTRGRGENA
jgi:DNA mismatch repair ATPase MutL